MKPGNQPHILAAASNLMGICFVLITGLKLTHADLTTYADEVSFVASFFFLLSCICSYLSLRQRDARRGNHYERIADTLFIVGIVALFAAMLIFGIGWF